MRPLLYPSNRLTFPTSGGSPATGNGTPILTEHIRGMRVQFDLDGAWDVDLEGTVDGANYVVIQANVVAGATLVEADKFWRSLRVKVNVVGAAEDFSAVLGGWTVGDWS